LAPLPPRPTIATSIEMSPTIVRSARGELWALGELLGTGAHGSVFAAARVTASSALFTPGKPRLVIKLVLMAESEVIQNEQRAARHPPSQHLCRLLDSFAHPSNLQFCFVYERLEVTLEEVLRTNLRFDESHAFFHISLGVEAMHRAGLLHRDLKPANVMFCDGVGKLIDYGFSAPFGEDGPKAFAVPYRAPEIVTGGKCTEAGDAWALGVIAYEMATRKPLFAPPTHQTNEQLQESMEHIFGLRRGCLCGLVACGDDTAVGMPSIPQSQTTQRGVCAASANALLIVSPRARLEALRHLLPIAQRSDSATINMQLN